jgi:hypothetical protein
VVKVVSRFVPTPFTIAMIATEMPAAMRPYNVVSPPTRIRLRANCRGAHWPRPENRKRAHISIANRRIKILRRTSRNECIDLACASL